MKRLLTLLLFAFFAITTAYGQTQANLPQGTVPFGTGLFRAPDGDIWGGSKFDQYTNLGNWERVADSLGAKINWSDTTLIATKTWVAQQLNNLPPSGVLSVEGDGVDNTDPANPVISYPTPSDIGALSPGDNVSELTNDAGYLTTETDPTVPENVKAITQTDIDNWDGKQDEITGAASTIDTDDLTVNRALISNSVGKVAVTGVTSTQLGYLAGATGIIQLQINEKVNTSEVGAADGVAPLGGDGKVPSEYLPTSGSYKGTWDASTNTPTLADGTGVNGDRYRVSVGGTVDLGSGNINFVAGDDVIYNGTVWQRSPSGVTVTSVAGKTGDVVLVKGDVGLGNVDNTSDLDKPISNAVQAALDLKLNPSALDAYYTKTNLQTSGQAQVNWGNVTNTPTTLTGYGILDAVSLIASESSFLRGPTFTGNIDNINNTSIDGVSAGATGTFPEGIGTTAQILTMRSMTTSLYGQILQANSTDGLYFRGGNSGGPFPWRQVASRDWVNTLPGVAQTLSLGVAAGNIGISGGNNVALTSLGFGAVADFLETFDSPGTFSTYNSSGSVNYPNTTGAGIRRQRAAGSTSGAFEIWKDNANNGKLQFNVGATGTSWKGWETFLSEENIWIQGADPDSPVITGTGLYLLQNNLSGNFPQGTSGGYVLHAQVAGNPLVSFQMGRGNTNNSQGRVYLRTGSSATSTFTDWKYIVTEDDLDDYLPTTSPAGSITQTDIDNWNEAAQYSAPETVIPTTVNFTIDWQTDIAPGGTETYAELHGNTFIYNAFYESGGFETNYSPAVRIDRDVNGDIITVQFADILSGSVIIK